MFKPSVKRNLFSCECFCNVHIFLSIMVERSSLISYPKPFWPIRPHSSPVHLQHHLCHWPAVYSKQHLQALFIATLKLRMTCGQTSTHLTSFSPFKSLLRVSSAIIPWGKKKKSRLVMCYSHYLLCWLMWSLCFLLLSCQQSISTYWKGFFNV